MTAKTLMHNRTQRRSGGFSLVEALAAGMILAASAIVIGGGVTQAMRSQSIVRDTLWAAELLDHVLTQIDMIGPARLYYGHAPTQGPLDERFSWQAKVEPQLEGDLYEVTVQINWQAPHAGESASRVVKAHTLINDAPGSRNLTLEWEDL